MTASAIAGLVGALAVTAGISGLALAWLRRVSPGALAGRGVPLRVLQRTAIGPRHSVALVQVADRVLVVGLAEDGTSLLAELDEAARARALEGVSRPAANASTSAAATARGALAFGESLRRACAPLVRALRSGALPVLVAALALAGAATARAQGAPKTTPVPNVHITVPQPAKGPVTRVAAPAPSRLPGPIVLPPPIPQVDLRIGEGPGAVHLSGAVGLVIFFGALTLLPALFLLMTSFTRILIVLHFLRSALGTQTTPPTQLLVALAVLLTGVVMHPVLERTNKEALQPYFAGQIQQVEAYGRAVQPFREFMLRNVREQDLATMAQVSGIGPVDDASQLPLATVVTAFVLSELRTSFQMGFVIYLPFVVVDVIVASVLMSLGMFMLPPVMISMPLKLLLFVLADGWTLVVQNLVASFK